MIPFEQHFPEPLQGVVNHAERFCAAVALAETDQCHEVAEGARELSLSETWVIGRAAEIETVVDGIVADWRSGKLSLRGASAAIEGYLVHLHRRMADQTCLDEPPCCSSALESMTVDFFASSGQFASSYPRDPLKRPPVLPPPIVQAAGR